MKDLHQLKPGFAEYEMEEELFQERQMISMTSPFVKANDMILEEQNDEVIHTNATNNRFARKMKTFLTEIKEVENEHDTVSKKISIRESELYQNHSKFISKLSDAPPSDDISVDSSNNMKKLAGSHRDGTNVERKIDSLPSVSIKTKKIKTVQEIQELSGMIKLKFDWENLKDKKYQPWDCPAINEEKFMQYYNDFESRKKMVNFCSTSFLKIYPSFKRIDSSNLDPVKGWICGVQIAALNIQSLEDDSILINTIMFKVNRNLGYVPKPDHLTGHLNYDRSYTNPVLKVNIEFISGFMLYMCNSKVKIIDEVSLLAYLVGSPEDDGNLRYFSKRYRDNLINVRFDREVAAFDIYEKDLSFIIIKLECSGKVFARACLPLCVLKQGLRVVPLLDENCKEYESSQLLVRISKETLKEV